MGKGMLHLCGIMCERVADVRRTSNKSDNTFAQLLRFFFLIKHQCYICCVSLATEHTTRRTQKVRCELYRSHHTNIPPQIINKYDLVFLSSVWTRCMRWRCVCAYNISSEKWQIRTKTWPCVAHPFISTIVMVGRWERTSRMVLCIAIYQSVCVHVCLG